MVRAEPPSLRQALTLQQALDLGLQHYNSGDLSKAEEIYRQILKTYPDHLDVLYLLGVIAHQMGENYRAVGFINKALALKPDFAEAHSHLGLALKELGRLDDALDHYHQAIKLRPDFAEAYYNLGNALRELGRLDEAVQIYYKVLYIRPDFAEVLTNLGALFQQTGQLDEAVTHYEKALAINPDLAEAYNNLGLSLMKLGRPDEAVASFEASLELEPRSVDLRNALAQALHSQGKLREAEEFYREALELTPPDRPYFPSFALLGRPERHFWMMGTIALLQELERPISMLEVGTWVGSSLLTWDQSITSFNLKGGKILCVDPWESYFKSNEDESYRQLNAVADLGIAYAIFCHNKNLATCEVEHNRGFSCSILSGLESGSFDIVYIDGSHYYDDVIRDIQKGCRLVRNGGYICGDDLEVQWKEASQDHIQEYKNNEDYVKDTEGRYYHPGVTAAVYEELGDVSCYEGYWIMQKQGDKFVQVKIKEFDYFTPSHFSSEWKNKFNDYVKDFSTSGGSKEN